MNAATANDVCSPLDANRPGDASTPRAMTQEGSAPMRDKRTDRRIREARETAAYIAETARDRIVEVRREVAWLLDTSPTKPSIFQPYGIGWDRYA